MEKKEYKSYEKIYSEFSKKPEDYIEKCEKRYDDFLESTVNKVVKKGIKRIFICGQSGSGKTTTSLRLTDMLNKKGLKTHIVELDDFFFPRGKHRINKDGKEDFESIFALDLKSIYKFADNIRNNKPVVMPDFDFKAGTKGEEKELIIGSEDVLVIEGLHSFNDRIQNAFGATGKNLNIFVSLMSGLLIGDTKLSKTDLRFARRLIRDYYHRNANPDWTIELWQMVRAGEKRYVSGYLKKADILFDTFIEYEIFLHKNDFVRLSEIGAQTAKSKGYYKTLLNKFKKIDVPHKVNVPSRSVLNEFKE